MVPFSQQTKTETYGHLKDALLTALEKGEIPMADMSESARYIGRNLNIVESQTELTLFLRDLTNRWPAYRPAFIHYKNQEVTQSDAAKIADIKAKLQSFGAH